MSIKETHPNTFDIISKIYCRGKIHSRLDNILSELYDKGYKEIIDNTEDCLSNKSNLSISQLKAILDLSHIIDVSSNHVDVVLTLLHNMVIYGETWDIENLVSLWRTESIPGTILHDIDYHNVVWNGGKMSRAEIRFYHMDEKTQEICKERGYRSAHFTVLSPKDSNKAILLFIENNIKSKVRNLFIDVINLEKCLEYFKQKISLSYELIQLDNRNKALILRYKSANLEHLVAFKDLSIIRKADEIVEEVVSKSKVMNILMKEDNKRTKRMKEHFVSRGVDKEDIILSSPWVGAKELLASMREVILLLYDVTEDIEDVITIIDDHLYFWIAECVFSNADIRDGKSRSEYKIIHRYNCRSLFDEIKPNVNMLRFLFDNDVDEMELEDHINTFSGFQYYLYTLFSLYENIRSKERTPELKSSLSIALNILGNMSYDECKKLVMNTKKPSIEKMIIENAI